MGNYSEESISNSPTTPSRVITPPRNTVLGSNRISKPAHGFLPSNVPSIITPVGVVNPAIPPACDEDPRQLGTGPQLYNAQVQSLAIGGAAADIYVQLPYGCKVFFLGSVLTPQNSIFFHLTPLGKQYGGSNAIVPKGNEPWWPMTNQPVSTSSPYYWSVLKFKRPIQAFYLDMGNENGSQNFANIVCVKDEEEFVVAGGPWQG
jgi:hypothetical protein